MLSWGKRYLMVEPNHFRVDYEINPFMDTADQPDPVRTREEWLSIIAAIESAGGEVAVLPQLPEAPDMVYAMNLGLPVLEGGRGRVVLSHMRYEQRRMETPAANALVPRPRLLLDHHRPRRRRRALRGRRRVRVAR